jgi:hypothetical protein
MADPSCPLRVDSYELVQTIRSLRGRIPLARAAQLGAPGQKSPRSPTRGHDKGEVDAHHSQHGFDGARHRFPGCRRGCMGATKRGFGTLAGLIPLNCQFGESRGRHGVQTPIRPLDAQPGGRARRPLVGPPEDEVLPLFPRRRPTLQRHARRITSTATADGNATRRVQSKFAATVPLASYLRIEERELEAGSKN